MRYANEFLLAYVAFLLLSEAMMGRRDSDVSGSAGLWGLFWREAGIDGCTEAFPAKVSNVIAHRWQALFSGASSGSHVLDIGCGRGAVLDHARRAGLAGMSGVDLAVLPPGPFDIRSGINAAALPFADRGFSIVTSQFGIEYAGLAIAGAEAARVADANLWLLLHAAEGPVVAQGSAQVAQIAWLSDGLGYFVRLRRHILQPTATTAADITAMRAAIVTEAESAENTTLLEAVWQAVPTLLEGADSLPAINRLAADLAAHGKRLEAMVTAAPSRAATDALATFIRGIGFEVRIEDLGSPPAARWLIATRHGQGEMQ